MYHAQQSYLKMFKKDDYPKIEKLLVAIAANIVKQSFSVNPLKEVLIREVTTICEEKVSDRIVLLAIIKIKEKNCITVSEFINQIKELKYIKESNAKCIFIMPYKNLFTMKNFFINGQEFKIINRKQCKDLIELGAFKNTISYSQSLIASIENDVKVVKYFLLIESTGSELFKVWNKIENNFAILRGIYDWSFQVGFWTIQSFFSVRAKFIHPNWMYIKFSNGKSDIGRFNVVENDGIFMGETKARKYLLSKTIKDVKSPVRLTSTKALIYDCFRLYGEAFAVNHKASHFLSLWQLIETGCMAQTTGGNTQSIIQRLKLIVQETQEFDIELSGILKNLAQKRNDIVHRGMDNSDQKDLSILKLFAEYLISWLITKEKKLVSKTHIEKYFELKTTPDAVRNAILDTVKYLNRNSL